MKEKCVIEHEIFTHGNLNTPNPSKRDAQLYEIIKSKSKLVSYKK